MMHIPSCHSPVTLSCLCVSLGKVLVCVLNIAQILGIGAITILLVGQVVKAQSNSSPSQTSWGFAFLPSLQLLSVSKEFSLYSQALETLPSQKCRSLFLHLVYSVRVAPFPNSECSGPAKLFLSARAAVRHPVMSATSSWSRWELGSEGTTFQPLCFPHPLRDTSFPCSQVPSYSC